MIFRIKEIVSLWVYEEYNALLDIFPLVKVDEIVPLWVYKEKLQCLNFCTCWKQCFSFGSYSYVSLCKVLIYILDWFINIAKTIFKSRWQRKINENKRQAIEKEVHKRKSKKLRGQGSSLFAISFASIFDKITYRFSLFVQF